MESKSQEGGVKFYDRYFIFYSSKNNIEKNYSNTYEQFNIEKDGNLPNFYKDTFKSNFIYQFNEIKNNPSNTFHTNLSVDNLLTLFYNGFYMKNNTKEIYINVFNSTIYNEIRKIFFSDNLIMNMALENFDITKILNKLNNNIDAMIKKETKEETKILLNKLYDKINKLLEKNNSKSPNIIKKNKINFIKKMINIFKIKNLNKNELIEILLDDTYQIKKIKNYNKLSHFNCNNKECFKLNYFKKITNKNIDEKHINENAMKIINFLRDKYKIDIDSYFIVNANTVFNEIIYHKKFNNLNKIEKLSFNILLNKNILNKNILNENILNKNRKIKNLLIQKLKNIQRLPFHIVYNIICFAIFIAMFFILGWIFMIIFALGGKNRLEYFIDSLRQ